MDRGLLGSSWKIDGYSMGVALHRLGGEVTLRCGYLSSREKVCHILSMGYDQETEPEKKAKGMTHFYCLEAEKTTLDLSKTWTGQGACPFEAISESRIENDRRRWKVPVPNRERRDAI